MIMSTETAQEFIKRKKREFADNPQWIKTKDISGKGAAFGKRQKATLMPQSNYQQKVFIIERLERVRLEGTTTHRKAKVGDLEYRFGYFVVGRRG